MNALDMLPSDAHRALLAVLQAGARGRSRSLTTDRIRELMAAEYGCVVTDRDMRQIRSELVAWGYPCFPGPEGYYYGVDSADLQDARAYVEKKVMPMLKERKEMRFAFEAEMRRKQNVGQTQMDLPIRMHYPMGQQTVRWPT